MKNKAVCFCNLALGLLYIATTVWGYSIAFPMKGVAYRDCSAERSIYLHLYTSL